MDFTVHVGWVERSETQHLGVTYEMTRNIEK